MLKTIYNKILERIHNHCVEKRMIEELYSLSDRELLDLGITKYDIPYIVCEEK